MSIFVKMWAVLLTATLSLLATLPAAAQVQWPGKPITYIVPYPPGGMTDILGRLMAQKLGAALNTTVIVDNKPGAAGAIGSGFVARAAPDGYTILGTAIGPQAIIPNLVPNLSYDPVKSFEPVSLVATIPHVLVVGATLPYETVNDVINAAKTKPGSLTFAGAGNGGIVHMQSELFKIQTGIDMLHVPYKGDMPAIQDVLGGHVSLMLAPIAAALPHLQSGKLRALAVTSPKRLKALPNVPTMAEAGVSDFEVEQWQAIYVPAHTPKPIVQRLHAEIVRILKEPDVVAKFESLGVTPVGSTPEQLVNVQKADSAKWAKVIKTAGIKAD
jgi:tripartite-type tricarboxylate transporter receptor subunit TctC